MTKHLGVVKWFNPKRGYGFITDLDTNDDFFVHHNALAVGKDVFKNLLTGEYIEFDITKDEKGQTLAVNVTGIRGGKLLCEHRVRKAKRTNEEDQTPSDVATAEEPVADSTPEPVTNDESVAN